MTGRRALNRRLVPSLAALQAFESAARHGNFTRAADELSLTQGAVSRQVRLIEESLNVRLFDRVRQRVVLTDLGRNYLEDVQRILNWIELSSLRAIERSAGVKVLELATLPTFCSRWLIPRISEFQALFPGVTVNCTSRHLPFDFSDEPFDAAIHYGRPSWPGAALTPLFEERMIAVAAPGLVNSQADDAADSLRSVTLLQSSARPRAWLDWFAVCGVHHEHAMVGPRYDQFEMLARAAMSGLGAALLPEFEASEDLASGQLVQISPVPLTGDNAYYLAIPENRLDNSTIIAFRDWIFKSAHTSSL